MKYVAVLCLLALLPAVLHAEPPCGRGNRKGEACGVLRFQVVNTVGAVLVISTVSFTGGADSGRIAITGPSTFTRKVPAAGKVDTASYAHPAEGVKISGTVTVVPFKGLQAYVPVVVPWEFTEPVTPKAVVDVKVIPTSLDGLPGSTALVCTMATLSDGSKTRVAPWSPACESAYLVWAQS